MIAFAKVYKFQKDKHLVYINKSIYIKQQKKG